MESTQRIISGLSRTFSHRRHFYMSKPTRSHSQQVKYSSLVSSFKLLNGSTYPSNVSFTCKGLSHQVSNESHIITFKQITFYFWLHVEHEP